MLPFGLSTAPYVFTELLHPLVRLWWSRGHKILLYLDDGVCAVSGVKDAADASQYVRNTLTKVVSEGVSVWNPAQTVNVRLKVAFCFSAIIVAWCMALGLVFESIARFVLAPHFVKMS